VAQQVLRRLPLGGLVVATGAVLWANRRRIGRALAFARMSAGTRNVVSVLNTIEHADDMEDSDDEDEDDAPALDQVGEGEEDAEATAAAVLLRMRGKGKRRRRPVRRELQIGRFILTGAAAEVAQRAKLAFGGTPRTEYNRIAVRRWLNKELREKVRNVRTRDLLTWLPLMELYVFFKTDEDVAMETAVEELQAMGRIRGGEA